MTSRLQGKSAVSLVERARLSVLWNTGLVTAISCGQFVLMLVLVRILDPATYGVYGLLMGIIGVAYVFSAQSFADYLLQVRADEQLSEQEIFTASTAVNILLCVLTNLSAYAIGFHGEYAQASTPLHWLSLSLLLQPPRALRTVELKRALDWRRIRVLHASGFLLSAVASVIIAMKGGGIFALLVPHFIVPLPFLYDLFVVRRWRPTWSWSYMAFRPAMRFGINRQMSGALGAGRRLLESSAVTQLLGFGSLGLLGRAQGLGELLCSRLHNQSIEALYPALTRFGPGTQTISRVNGLVLRATTWFCVPAAALGAGLADLIVRIVYGSQWLEVIPLAGWAIGIAALSTVNLAMNKLFLASNFTRQCLALDALNLVGTIACVLLVLLDGLLAYLQGLLVVQACVLIVGFRWALWRGVVSPAVIFDCILVPGAATAIAAASVAGLRAALPTATPDSVMVLVTVMAFSLAYLASLRLGSARLLDELLNYMPMRSSLKRILVLA